MYIESLQSLANTCHCVQVLLLLLVLIIPELVKWTSFWRTLWSCWNCLFVSRPISSKHSSKEVEKPNLAKVTKCLSNAFSEQMNNGHSFYLNNVIVLQGNHVKLDCKPLWTKEKASYHLPTVSFWHVCLSVCTLIHIFRPQCHVRLIATSVSHTQSLKRWGFPIASSVANTL